MRMVVSEHDPAPEPRLQDSDPLPPEDRTLTRDTSLDVLYRTHASRLLRFFARRTGPTDAADLVQETFVRMARTEPTARQVIDSPGAFLTRIATNLLKDRAKTAARRSASLHLVYDERLHGGINPHRLLDNREALSRLEAAVNRLNRKTREIFLLHRVEGLTYAEIADEMGMSVKGVKKQMAKALFQLRRDVGPL